MAKVTQHLTVLQHQQLNLKLIEACVDGDLEKVRYWLTSPEVKLLHGQHARLHDKSNKALLMAVIAGHLEVVDYLLTSPEIIQAGQTHANIYVEEAYIFSHACETNHERLINYLVHDYAMQRTPAVDKILTLFPDIRDLFDKRALNEKLNQSLVLSAASKARAKI